MPDPRPNPIALPPPRADSSFALLRDPTLSSYREQLVEYLLLSELLQDAWLRRRQQIDVLRADVDGAGYDLVAECQGVIRHVQLKSSIEGGLARSQKVHVALAAQRSGCVVWVVLRPGEGDRLVRLSYRVFGSAPGEPILGLADYRIARHAKANAQGHKAERPRIRDVPRSAFQDLATTAEVSNWLFGPPTPLVA